MLTFRSLPTPAAKYNMVGYSNNSCLTWHHQVAPSTCPFALAFPLTLHPANGARFTDESKLPIISNICYHIFVTSLYLVCYIEVRLKKLDYLTLRKNFKDTFLATSCQAILYSSSRGCLY